MSGNEAFEMVGERGWRRGLSNMFTTEMGRWWGTSLWWIQILIWAGIVGFMMVAVIFRETPDETAKTASIMIYSLFAGIFPAIAVIIIMQDALVGEKQSGTAAWVLSKPVSRPAFILSKLVANSIGVLATIVILPGIVAFILMAFGGKFQIEMLPFLAAMGVIFLVQLYFLTLVLMLGSLLNNRGAVIGIALGFLFLQQYIIGWRPVLKNFLPWTLAVPLNNQNDAMVVSLLSGTPIPSLLPLVIISIEIVVFVLITLWRFEKEEF
ncbi:MAG: ABC transporter permease [Omnitrophica WOR_2 bacterium]